MNAPIRIGLFAISLVLGVCFASAQESQPPFGTCAEWVRWGHQKAGGPDTPAYWAATFYKIGFTHGFASGIAANPRSYDLDRSVEIHRQFMIGYSQVLFRPAILIDVFDAKCSDYRNVGLRLIDVGLVAILEMGGVQGDRVEEALRLLRSAGTSDPSDTRLRVIKALSK